MNGWVTNIYRLKYQPLYDYYLFFINNKQFISELISVAEVVVAMVA
jgi:hypothetical protein